MPRPRQAAASFCHLRGTVYEYRRIVPPQWQAVIGQKAWRISLKTGNRTEAVRKAQDQTAEHDALLARLEAGEGAAHFQTQAQALRVQRNAAVRETEMLFFAQGPHDPESEALKALEKERWETARPFRAQEAAATASALAAAEKALAALPEPLRAAIMKEGSVQAAWHSLRQSELARAFMEAAAAEGANDLPSDLSDLPDDEQDRIHGDIRRARTAMDDATAETSRLREVLAPTGLTKPTAAADETASENSISVMMERWFQHQGQREETTRKYRTYMRRLIDVIGDCDVRTVTSADLRRFLDTVSRLPDAAALPPTNRPGDLTGKVARDASVADLIAWAEGARKLGEDVKGISPMTIGKHVAAVAAFFGWMLKNTDLIDVDPSVKLSAPKDNRKKAEKVRAFTSEELHTLVAQADTQWGPTDPRTMLVLAGIYTGARLEELGQIAPANVRQHASGFYYVKIDDDDEGRQLKNEPSVREVPLPDALVRYGFVDCVKKAEGPTVFGLKRVRGRFGRSFTNVFARLCDACGLTDRRLNFHSLRHAYPNLLKAAQEERRAPRDARKQLMGHVEGDAHEDYERGYELAALYGWVKDMPDVRRSVHDDELERIAR